MKVREANRKMGVNIKKEKEKGWKSKKELGERSMGAEMTKERKRERE